MSDDDRLAIHGGPPVRPRLLPYGGQLSDDDDIQAVAHALKDDWLTTGPRVAEFERAVPARAGARHAVAVNSGTAALHVAAFAAGIGPGDEVIVAALTFAASGNVVLYLGGRPVFADVRADTLNVDPLRVTEAITPRTRAIITVDFAGQPCELGPLRELADRHRLALIDDAAHALGLSQLTKLDRFLARRRAIAERYGRELAGVPGVLVPAVAPDVRHAWHIFPILVDAERVRTAREAVFAALRAEGIGVTVHYIPVYQHPYYQRLGYPKSLCPVAESAYERLLTLPVSARMSDGDAADVVTAVRKVFRH